MVPICWSAQADETGVDRVHIAINDSLYVYELDVGWSFAGDAIPAYFTTNWIYNDPPVVNSNLMKVALSGLSYGESHINVQVAADLSTTYSVRDVDLSLPRTAETTVSDDFVPYDNINSINARGRCFSLKFTNDVDAIDEPEPSHICQVLITGQTSPGALYL